MDVAGKIAALVFDMDGVLLDSESVYDVCWKRKAAEWGLEDIDSVHRRCLGRSKEDSLALLRQAYGSDFDGEAFWTATDAYCERLEREQGLPLKPFAREILAYGRERGYRLALASSTYRETVKRQLMRAGLWDCFEVIVCGDDIAHAKPAPDIYLEACARLELPPERCVAVEDSPNGIRSAAAAGLWCVMVPDRIPADDDIRTHLWKLCDSLQDMRHIV